MSNFTFEPTNIAEVLLVTARRHGDDRGDFMETYEREAFRQGGILAEFMQDNQSMSKRRGTIRGLHFQAGPAAQAKFVRVMQGAIFDVAVDLRQDSQTYGHWCGAELSSDNGCALFVPRGFAHGFCTLADDTIVAYKVDAPYSKAHEGGIAWNDATIGIDWPVDDSAAILSERDRALPGFDPNISDSERTTDA
jgi:dTDP-4-dehydrorhamnose 3,5-epimerase